VHCVSWGHKKAIVNCHMSNCWLSVLFMDKHRLNPALIRKEGEDCQPCFIPIRTEYVGASPKRVPYAIATSLHCAPGGLRVFTVWDDKGPFLTNAQRDTSEERHPDVQNLPRPTQWPGRARLRPAVAGMIGGPTGAWPHSTIETGIYAPLYIRQTGWEADLLIHSSLLLTPSPLPGRERTLKIPHCVYTV